MPGADPEQVWGRVAQWESVPFTPERSLVQSQPRPPLFPDTACLQGGMRHEADDHLRLSKPDLGDADEPALVKAV